MTRSDDALSLHRQTLAVRAGVEPSQYGENSEALYLSSGFLQPDATTSVYVNVAKGVQPLTVNSGYTAASEAGLARWRKALAEPWETFANRRFADADTVELHTVNLAPTLDLLGNDLHRSVAPLVAALASPKAGRSSPHC